MDLPSNGGLTPQSYLATSGMPSLPIAVQEELEEPITAAELGAAWPTQSRRRPLAPMASL